MEAREKLNAKVREIKEKYKEAIYDICMRYTRTVDVGYDMLIAIARALYLGEEPLYITAVELDDNELVKDYAEYLALCQEVYNNR